MFSVSYGTDNTLSLEFGVHPADESAHYHLFPRKTSAMTPKKPYVERKVELEASSKGVISCHPMGIKPAGNLYWAGCNSKEAAGLFSYLPDELLILIFELAESLPLLQLGGTW